MWDKKELFDREIRPIMNELAKKLTEHKMPAIVRVQYGLTDKHDLVMQIAEVEGLDVVCPIAILAAYLALQEPIKDVMSVPAIVQMQVEQARQQKVLEIKQPKLVVVNDLKGT